MAASRAQTDPIIDRMRMNREALGQLIDRVRRDAASDRKKESVKQAVRREASTRDRTCAS